VQIPEMQALLKDILFQRSAILVLDGSFFGFSNANHHLYFTKPWIVLKSL